MLSLYLYTYIIDIVLIVDYTFFVSKVLAVKISLTIKTSLVSFTICSITSTAPGGCADRANLSWTHVGRSPESTLWVL